MDSTGDMFPIERSNLYHVWLQEREHVERNRWYLSERVGHDVGWHAAKLDWDMRFRAKWIAGLRASGAYPTG